MKENAKTKGVTGAVLTSRHVFFCELTQRKNELLPTSYGHVTIPYDVIVNGVIKDKVALIEVFKKMYEQTHTNVLSFHTTLNTEANKALQEIFQVSGYKQANFSTGYKHLNHIVYTRAQELTERILLLGTEDSAVLLRVGGSVKSLVHFNKQELENTEAFTKAITTLLQTEVNQTLILAGIFPHTLGEIKTMLALAKIPYEVPNVWQNAFDFSTYVPSMSFDESISYAQSVALALETACPSDKATDYSNPEVTKQGNVEITEVLGPVARAPSITESLSEAKPLSKSPEDHEETPELKGRTHKAFRITLPLFSDKL